MPTRFQTTNTEDKLTLMRKQVNQKYFLNLVLVLTIFAASFCGKRVTQTGNASYYADRFSGRKTASGETFRQRKRTAAHRTLPFGTKVKVKNLANGRTVKVRINDRGPFVEGRIIDLSKKAARRLRMLQKGVEHVEIRYKKR